MPELTGNGGKGSKPRENANYKAYRDNYDKIFRKNKKEECDDEERDTPRKESKS